MNKVRSDQDRDRFPAGDRFVSSITGSPASDKIGLNRTRVIPHLFEEQVQRTPDRIALLDGKSQLTYAELNQRANQLARYLVRSGVTIETPIGLFMPRSVEMVVAILGILKSGAAYVPLDEANPPSRTEFIINDTGLRLLLTYRRSQDQLPDGATERVYLDEEREIFAQEPNHAVEVDLDGENLAYLVYTSGSTGVPKGVALPHRVFARCEFWAREIFRFTSEDRFLLKSVRAPEELLYPLFVGAPLVIAPPDAERDPALFIDTIATNGITVVSVSPAFLSCLLNESALKRCQSLRHILCSGETLPVELRQRFFSRLDANLYNFYGLAEAPYTTISCCTAKDDPATVPIGWPVDAQVQLLDSDLRPVPPGNVGELYISGPGLARGYLNLATLTSERFISGLTGDSRLYQTGDLGYYSERYGFVLTGRTDHQIKIRGFRVELGEVEAALRRHRAVREAVAFLKNSPLGEAELGAFLVLRPNASTASAELRNFLRERLPDYAIPSHFRVVERFPLGSTGKVDRKAVENLAGTELPAGGVHVAPQNQVERQLTRIWQEVLNRQGLGIHDDFFALGGHSLLATRVMARIRPAFGIDLPLRDLFEAPTIRQLAERLAAAHRTETPPLSPVPRAHLLPVSFAQERLWFLDQMEPDSSAYHIPEAYLLRGSLDIAALERSLQLIVNRHEVLRTNFQSVGKPFQVIAPEREITLLREDVSGLKGEEQTAEVRRIIADGVARKFDLASGPVLHVTLVRLGPERHLLLTSVHHIASDDWSMALFFSEVSAFYSASLSPSRAVVPDLPVQYADYAIWQRQWMDGPEFARQLAFWRRELIDAPVLELPTDRPRPPEQTHAGARYSFEISPETTARLIRFNRQENVTPFMTLLAAFQVLLSRHSGQEDIVIGTPITNRHQVELENLIGFFVNTLVLRANLAGDPDFREIVRRTRRSALDAYQYQDFPFEELVKAVNPPRDLSRHPLFQVLFSVENGSGHPPRLQGLEVSLFPIPENSIRFDLELQMSVNGDRCAGFFSYNTDLFDGDRIERMARHYELLLGQMLGQPDRPVFQLPMLPANEQNQLLVEWNSTQVDYPTGKCIHHLFEEQVECTPESVAVVFGDKTLTYRELNERADRLAHYLRAHGVTPGTRVGICSEPSLEMVAGLLGILKSGAAYVPLDHHSPPGRLALIWDDAGVTVLVVQQALRALCAGFTGETVVLDGPDLNGPADNTSPAVTGEDAAYVIYTSGSTGRPKGVVIKHEGVVNFLRSMRKELGITGEDVLLAVTTIAFDISVLELFLPLTVGARVVISADDVRWNGQELAELLKKSGATILQATPATWNLLLQFDWTERKLKALTGGETLSADLARELLGRCGSLWNLYGPTETTIWSTLARIQRSDEITIGKPIANTQVYLVNSRMQPVPIGVPGELLIGGSGVATGYLGQPALTVERFVPDPFSPEAGRCLYRTGDLCRYRSDGNLEFLGRMDHQLKIRGFRVELGEIEAALMEHPAIDQCVVVDRVDNSAVRRLVAYVLVADRGSVPETRGLREFLGRKLPDYMLPAAFVAIEHWPLTRSGKIDRKALPEPVLDRDEVDAAAPRDTIERQLVRIWESVLGVRGLGINDNFFELGGHSLLAVRLIAEVNQTFGIHLPLGPIFRAPTIEGLASAIRNVEELKLQPPGLIVPGVREARQAIYWAPSIGEVERFVECHYLARVLRGACDFYGFDPAPEFTDIGRLAEHCIRLIRAEQPQGPYSLVGYCQCGHVAYEIAQRLEREGQEISLLAVIDSSARDLTSNLRQKFYWFRDGLRGNPHTVLRRIRAAVQHRIPGSNGRDGVTQAASPEGPFSVHGNAARRHKARPFDGTVVLFRSEEVSLKWRHSPKLGWDALARNVEVHTVPSPHSRVMGEQQSIDFIAEKLKSYLP